MRRWTAALLLVLVTAVAACGGSTEAPVVGADGSTVRSSTTGPSTTGTSTTGARRGAAGAAEGAETASCVARGITVPPFNEGACRQGGVRFVVANGRSLMRLRTMNVAIRGFSVREQLGTAAQPLSPQGSFLLIELAVTNRTAKPQRVLPGQTLLLLEPQRFEEQATAERRVHADALAFARRRPIGPGETVTGVVIYDVAVSDVERITRDGQLLVTNFGGLSGGHGREIGQFRIGVG